MLWHQQLFWKATLQNGAGMIRVRVVYTPFHISYQALMIQRVPTSLWRINFETRIWLFAAKSKKKMVLYDCQKLWAVSLPQHLHFLLRLGYQLIKIQCRTSTPFYWISSPVVQWHGQMETFCFYVETPNILNKTQKIAFFSSWLRLKIWLIDTTKMQQSALETILTNDLNILWSFCSIEKTDNRGKHQICVEWWRDCNFPQINMKQI